MKEQDKIPTSRLRPYLKRYMDSMGIRFKSGIKFHCPFKKDHTRNDMNASAIICRNDITFQCFGCGRKGDIIDMCMELEGLTFIEAARKLCEQFDIDYNEEVYNKPKKSQILEDIASFIATRGSTKLALDKGLPVNICRGYGIGTVSTKKIEEIASSFSRDDKIKTGLWRMKDDSLELLRMFGRDILTFTIKDDTGSVVGMVGRQPKGRQPKFMDPVGNKYGNKEILYLIDKAIPTIRSTERVILVEGYTDALQMHMIGKRNTVAVRCATPTEDQLARLNNYCANLTVILMLDNDETGNKMRMDVLRKRYINGMWRDMNFNVLMYPKDCNDPDEFLRKVEPYMVPKLTTMVPGLSYYFMNSTHDCKDIETYIKECIELAATHSTCGIDVENNAHTLAIKFSRSHGLFKREIKKLWIRNFRM